MKKIKILFFTGNRAELSFIENAIEMIGDMKNFEISLLVSGSHFLNEFGNTVKYMKKLNVKTFNINVKIQTQNISKTSDYYSKITEKFNKFIKRKKFDYIFISSDRFESFAIANIAFLNNIQIIHYEGGDLTSGGSYDDYLRHSISRLASLHFVTNEDSLKRLVKFGEEKNRIKNIGLLSLKQKTFKVNETKKMFDLNSKKYLILFTYHPLVYRKNKNRIDIKNILVSLEKLIHEKKIQLIITQPNFDPYHNLIVKELDILIKKNYCDVKFIKSLGTENYHRLLDYCGKTKKGFCVGNSSSGIKEAEFFDCPAINIGPRQDSRTKGNNVIDVKLDKNQIYKKINLLINKKQKKKIKRIYFKPNSKNIIITKIINHYNNYYFKIKKCTF